jgi:hypothetical protein
MRRTFCTWLVFVLCAQLGFAQADPWERVKLIEKGKNVTVTLVSGKSFSGKMEEWKPDGLVLRKGKNKTVEVAKSDAAKVYMTVGMSRGRRASWAFGIGFGTGVGLHSAMLPLAEPDSAGLAAALVVAGGGLDRRHRRLHRGVDPAAQGTDLYGGAGHAGSEEIAVQIRVDWQSWHRLARSPPGAGQAHL